jgi:ubiquinone/menaquinone biosynthesis C-methylase UbiE
METDMLQNISTGFSSVYEEYETLSHENFIDIARRNFIRKQVESYLQPHHKMLEINAGSGIDATYFAQKGYSILATDIAADSEKYIKSKSAGLQQLRFQKCSFTELGNLDETFDHIFSNFGGLNCTDDLEEVFAGFGKVLNPGAYVTLVIMPRFYPWEMLTFLKGNKNALRRFQNGVPAHVGNTKIKTFYHSPKKVKAAMGKTFRTVKIRNIGTFYPSAHFTSLGKYKSLLSVLVRFDEWASNLFIKGVGDYFIITFQKK